MAPLTQRLFSSFKLTISQVTLKLTISEVEMVVWPECILIFVRNALESRQ